MKSQEANMQRNNDSGSFSEMGWVGHYGKGLSRRETQFLILVAAGMTTKQIARRFDLSPCSVEKRLDDARFYLQARNRAELVAKAMAKGVIQSEQVAA
ncbi:helix-turn-helix transcriptional regulator [Pseudomonas syringae pv. tagetis]|uniref:Helix-turn-helix transcriptional regulator n=1 Tax=Pseudomonas syringae pv. tagetis TaxID=129140 RepID=A0ABW7NL98_9PSED|nr:MULTISPECIES: helix-turn-helix transcriptional regulator [Pseudomonas syringae group]MCI3945527.1 HTH-type quorum sensing-dependent transcriptional regulator VjbR [Pseudomonas syringae]RMW08822.1 hypothetical protein ALO98_200217 [Pseudomonas syringae pv. tagetis]UNB70281.1 helix-turn-helix transcriptional regulator [Pseudomonas syringae pv. tagetis]